MRPKHPCLTCGYVSPMVESDFCYFRVPKYISFNQIDEYRKVRTKIAVEREYCENWISIPDYYKANDIGPVSRRKNYAI